MIFRRRIQLKLDQQNRKIRHVNDAELAKERSQLRHKIEKLRVIQKDSTPQIASYVF